MSSPEVTQLLQQWCAGDPLASGSEDNTVRLWRFAEFVSTTCE
ncbi:hypothetical protein GKIL_1898 [Gloeobacter kilaueensis JS1]|uniref:Uncharacterized protein n=1 Tax=Gloeobacter kilaueensis (strain ATCC BAA-2537 / CCAP 1431/1 / ULC 316 / JS1) TaxID=1183438 RepID=U5QKJ4_GLOK1|nr:hypothetical protein GKIL_1898 [Gloeobacter kilaueensis JS1]